MQSESFYFQKAEWLTINAHTIQLFHAKAYSRRQSVVICAA